MKIGFEVNYQPSLYCQRPVIWHSEAFSPSKVATPKVHGFNEKLLFKKTHCQPYFAKILYYWSKKGAMNPVHNLVIGLNKKCQDLMESKENQHSNVRPA